MVKAACNLIFLLILVLFAPGCTTQGHYVRDLNRSMSDIHVAIRNLYGVQSKSDDDKILYTPPLKRDPNDTTPENRMRERVIARIVIMGDRRPYDILVQVYLERKIRGVWEEVGLDENLSRDFSKEINRELIESRENRNVIDDFRAF